ncbi:CoA transferase [Streptomyces sp. NPDC058424]|uniref:CoA transferase n=1 Tax=Streptomyces sp. NPDC058424 TaxID=3346491 RepID=UPI003664546A
MHRAGRHGHRRVGGEALGGRAEVREVGRAGRAAGRGGAVGDLVAGLFASWAVNTALFDRERSGRGRYIDVAMLDSLVSLQVTAMSLLTATGDLPGRVGNRHPVSTPFDTYRTADGLVAIAVAGEAVFARFARLVGRPDMPSDPRFRDDTARAHHIEQVREITERWSAGLTTEQVLKSAQAAGVPAAPIRDLTDAVNSEQIRGRGLVGEFDHPVLGRTPYLRQPARFGPDGAADGAGTASEVRGAAAPSPALGEHTDAVVGQWLREDRDGGRR